MIIKKIILENYRSHKNTCIELSKGINLILGVNGSGKSSILEAIGNVIFDINDRTGKQKGKSFIRYGENSAKVEIEFLANDSRVYSIKNIFHSKKVSSSILRDLSTGEEFKDKEEVRTKLNELCGIKKSYTDVYENIIIAKQNEFINIFKEKPADREKVFNKIFNTEIYNDMYTGILKEIEDKYSKEKEKLEIEKNMISLEMKDESLYLDEIKYLEGTEKKLLVELDIKISEQKKIMEEIKEYNLKEKESKNLIEQFLNKKETIKEQKGALKTEILRAKRAKKSSNIIEENKESYEKYKILFGELEKNKEELKALKILEEENQRLLNLNERLTWEIEKFSDDKEKIIQNLNLKEAESQKLNEEFIKISKEEENLKEVESTLRKEIDKIKEIEIEIVSYEKTLFSLEEGLRNNIEKVEEKTKEKNEIKVNEIKVKLQNIEDVKKIMENQKNEALVCDEKIKVLEDAKIKLNNKLCPLLSESCENIKDKNINTYFDEKINYEIEKIEKLKESYIKLKEEIKNQKSLEDKLISYSILEKDINIISQENEYDKLKIEKIKFLIEKEKYKINNILKILNSESKKSIEERLQDTIVKRGNLNLLERQEKLNLLQKEIDYIKEELGELEEKNSQNIKLVDENKQNIHKGVDVKISFLETELKKIEIEQRNLQEAYNHYLQNINIASTLEETLTSIKKKIKNIFQLKEDIKVINFLENKISNELKEISIETLEEKLQDLNKNILENNKNLGTMKEKFSNLSKELNKVRSEKERINNLSIKLNKVENKLYKTKIIRSNIKGMGLKISKYMLENISLLASSNFNKITGRTERILWTNETYLENGKENKYAVYLIGEDKKIAFENLSGGEQVAVAISLRETMTEYFSNSRFIILDEPTNNLDKERKKLLAEYIGEILNNLDQSIIVTHDNTFREMAEKIIEL